jgi:hypothetical protein
MRSQPEGKMRNPYMVFCALFTLSFGACTHLSPPTRATPEQTAERERESATPNIIQVRTESSPEQCTVSFDDPAALGQILAFARLTFAVKTGRSSSGMLEECSPASHSDCWTYRQRCTRHDVNVDSVTYSHFHLHMERGMECYDFGDPSPLDPRDGFGAGFGRLVEGRCTPVNWIFTRRALYSHDRQHWIKIWVGNATSHTPTYFDMESVWVLPDQPIQLWFRKRDGTWLFWPELTAGNIWNLREWVRDVSEVRIRGAGTNKYGIGAFGIRD